MYEGSFEERPSKQLEGNSPQLFKIIIINNKEDSTMSRPKITEPMAISFGITIAVPVPDEIFTFDVQRDIYECERYVIKKRDETNNQIEKKAFDKCRAVLQWAIACSASLNIAEYSIYHIIEFSFSFNDFDTMLKFKEELNTRIDNFMIL